MGIADKDFGCSPDMSFVDGRPDRCGNRQYSLECWELSGLVAALRSKEPKDCSASAFCKVLSSRDVRACEPYLKQANKAFCDELALRVAAAKEQWSFKKGQPMKDIPPAVQQRQKEIEAAGQTGK